MLDIAAIQSALRQQRIDGWLLYDFRGLNILAKRVAQLSPEQMLSRRWFYFIPASGEPRKLVHRIEPKALDHLPGSATTYLRWQSLEAGVRDLIQGCSTVAMEYVPRNGNPYISRVDGGTIELVRSFGVNIVPSGDLIQLFEACLDDEQWTLHKEAAKHTRSAYDVAFGVIAARTKGGGHIHELEVQKAIVDHFTAHGLTCDHPPIVGVGPHSGDPHYEPRPGDDGNIRQGDFVLIDLWAKVNKPRGVYSDLTRVGFVGPSVPEKYEKIFQIVAAARDAGIQRVRDAFAAKEKLQGWQVDDATRNVIDKAGYGEYFCHRTGHSIGQEIHGNGAHMDNLETREERQVLPRSLFSIEPGIYMAEFGVRSEVNVFVDAEGKVHVTGGEPQKNVLAVV